MNPFGQHFQSSCLTLVDSSAFLQSVHTDVPTGKHKITITILGIIRHPAFYLKT
jgi:hypothetical protein